MTTEIDTVLTKYEADASQAIRETTRLIETERAAEKELATAHRVNEGLLGRLGEKLQEYRREEVQQARSTRFFAAQLGELLPASAGQAASALGILATTGSVAGLAFEGVKLVVEKVAEKMAEAEREARRLGEENAKAAKAASDAWRAYSKEFQDAEKAKSQLIFEAHKKELEQRVDASEAAVDETKKKIKANELLMASYDASERGDARRLQRAQAVHKELLAAELQAELELSGAKMALREHETAREQAASRERVEVLKREAQKAADEATAREKQYAESRAALLREAELVGLSDRAKLVAEWNQKIRRIHESDRDALRTMVEAKRTALLAFDAKADAEDEKAESEHWLRRMEIARKSLEIDQKAKEDARKQETEGAKVLADHMLGVAKAEDAEEERLHEKRVERIRAVAHIVESSLSPMIDRYGELISQSRAYNDALAAQGRIARESAAESSAAHAKMVQEVLAGISKQAAAKAIFELAEGFALLAAKDPGAGEAFISAGIFAGLAGASGIGAYAIGQNRGLTQEENERLAEATKEAGSGKGLGGSTGRVGSGSAGGGGGTVIERQVVYVVDGGFGTEAEAARRLARIQRTQQRLGMR